MVVAANNEEPDHGNNNDCAEGDDNKAKEVMASDGEGNVDEGLAGEIGAMLVASNNSKQPMKIQLPFCVVPYKDDKLFQFVCLDVWLLAGTTMNGLVYSVDNSGRSFTIMYMMPEIWLTPEIVDAQHEWLTNGTNLQEALASNNIAHLKRQGAIMNRSMQFSASSFLSTVRIACVTTMVPRPL